ncbi:hypothetical protein O6H91_11G068500 [Diphasiastrum complanatum]|uniref:Uncharacterized protein n=1 Tax=Diphasiastrum complanatum TaxID=34168 RepID=A0ACC2CAK8_DIPCM|nr:hypothetical protein O6H91_11G068500 [Diphasiastrum complanatum]
MSGVDENIYVNPSNGIPNHLYPLRPPLPPRPWGPRSQQSETQLSPLRMRGSAQLPQDEHYPRRRNRQNKSEAKVPTSATSSDDAMFERDSVNRPAFKTNIVTGGGPDIRELSFGNGPFRRLCMGLWEQLDNAMRQRERAIEDKEIEIAHNLSLLKAQSDVIAKERLQVEKLRQEADNLREQALKQTKQLEEQLAQLKKMQLSGQNLVCLPWYRQRSFFFLKFARIQNFHLYLKMNCAISAQFVAKHCNFTMLVLNILLDVLVRFYFSFIPLFECFCFCVMDALSCYLNNWKHSHCCNSENIGGVCWLI